MWVVTTRSNCRGSALFIVSVIIVFVMMLVVSVFRLTLDHDREVSASMESAKALHAARGGIEISIDDLYGGFMKAMAVKGEPTDMANFRQFLDDQKGLFYYSNQTQPVRDQPWYHVLVHDSHQVTYAAQTSLRADDSGEPVNHPLVPHFFSDFEDGFYLRNEQDWPES